MFKEKLAIIVPTKDRRFELNRLLQDISAQSIKPVHIVVVDGGDEAVDDVVNRFPQLNVKYVRSIPPSLTTQRNVGIKAVHEEATLVAFLDDDIIIETGALENMMRFWETAPKDIGGAAFNDTAEPCEKPTLLEKIFLVNTDRRGRILPSGFQSRPHPLAKDTQVQWLIGAAMVWRKNVFNEFAFDEWFTGYARYEEVDFAYRVGRKYKMFAVEDARIKHLMKLENIGFSFALGKMQIANRLYLVKKNPGLSLPLCIWACFGLFINNTIKGFAQHDKRYMQRSKGNMIGFLSFVLPDKILKSDKMQIYKKNIVMILCDIIAIIYLLSRKVVAFFSDDRGKKLRILVYHSVANNSFYKDADENNISLDAFRQHMLILKNRAKKIITLREAIKGLREFNLSSDSIAITFDDGIRDTYNDAIKILEELNIPATFFVVYEYANSDEKLAKPHAYQNRLFMNWPMIFSLKKKGFEVGSHSYSHQRLSALKDDGLDRETGYAKKKFEEKGIPVEYFAYPYGFYGDFSEKTEARVKKAGYKACFTNIMGDNSSEDDLFRLKRTRVSWRDNPLRFKMKINGAYDWIDALKYKLSRRCK